jgi:hypothetical protein
MADDSCVVPQRVPALNPFATRCVHPDVVPFVFPVGVNASLLVGRLREASWRGEIVGRHGSGKSTLVSTLVPLLQRAGRRVQTYRLYANEPASPPLGKPDWSPRSLIVIDGFEQLGPLARLRWRRLTRRRQTGLLVTSHRHVGLPRIWTTGTSLELAERLVHRLLDDFPSNLIRPVDVQVEFARHRGNLREMLFGLYDRYEQRFQQSFGNRARTPE